MFTKNKYGGFLKKTLKAASTKEGVATIGGATAGGWFGSSVGLAITIHAWADHGKCDWQQGLLE